MTVTNPSARPFTQTDWYGFAGAETWPSVDDGPEPQPVIREIGDWLLVADRNGVEAHTAKESPQGELDEVNYCLNLPLPTQALALALLNGLPDDFTPAAYGFEEA